MNSTFCLLKAETRALKKKKKKNGKRKTPDRKIIPIQTYSKSLRLCLVTLLEKCILNIFDKSFFLFFIF